MAKKKAKEDIEQENFNAALQDYKLELKLVYEKSQDAFEKQLSYLSAGALGFSMLVVEKVVGDLTLSKLNWILFTSWIFLTCTLVVNLISHRLAARNTFKSIKEIDENNYDSEKVTNRIEQINFINKTTIATFLLGILSLIMFVIVNSMSKEIKPLNIDQQKGHVPTSAPQNPRPNTGQIPTAPPASPARPTTNPPKK